MVARDVFEDVVDDGFFALDHLLGALDGVAVAAALEPGIVRKAERHYVQVELAGKHTRGQTIVDWSDQTAQEPNVDLVEEMDSQRLWELLQMGIE